MKVTKDSVAHALHELELEGFSFTDEELIIFNKIAAGEMTTEKARELFLSLPLK